MTLLRYLWAKGPRRNFLLKGKNSIILTHTRISIHDSLKAEIQAFTTDLPPVISNVMKTRTDSAIQSTDNLDQVENRLEDKNVLPGSAGQTDVTVALVKTSTNSPQGSTRKKMNVSVQRTDRSHEIC